MVTTNQKCMKDTQRIKRKEPKQNSKEDKQIMSMAIPPRTHTIDLGS